MFSNVQIGKGWAQFANIFTSLYTWPQWWSWGQGLDLALIILGLQGHWEEVDSVV